MAKADPCAALFGAMKQACEDTGKLVNGSGGSAGGILGGILGSAGTGFDYRHFMLRVAEFGIGAVLIIVAIDAGLKNSGSNPVVQSGKRLGKKVMG